MALGNLEITRAYLLQLIRDGEIKSMKDIRTRWGLDALAGTENAQIERDLNHWLTDFKRARLIRWTADSIAPTELIEAVQKALDFSLTDLSQEPFFGKPRRLPKAFDVFMVMPFSPDLESVYRCHIKKIVNRLGLTIKRGDDFFTTRSIINNIRDAIHSCKLVIADCTHRNPNVFYEIGIAHAIGRPVILMVSKQEDIPFDIAYVRTIIYDPTPAGMPVFERELEATIQNELA